MSPTHFAKAPGRVNLIGEHTDYHDGLCFPAAIDAFVEVEAREAEITRIWTDLNGEEVSFDVNALDRTALPVWARYPAGVAWALSEATGKRLPNIEAKVTSSLPAGSGLSASAAIEMAFATLWRTMANLDVTGAELARLGQRAENGFVGMNCGIMDQTASLFGRQDHALFLDTHDPGNPIPMKLPDGIAIVILDTMVKHELAASEYNLRRRESEDAALKLGVSALRWCTLAHLEANSHLLSAIEKKRAKHVITECHRVQLFRNSLDVGDRNGLGDLMRGSHISLRDDFEVSCAESDAMAESAWGAPGCLGARMMGGGFGGACIGLVEASAVEPFLDETAAQYRKATGIEPALRVCRAVDGARAWAA